MTLRKDKKPAKFLCIAGCILLAQLIAAFLITKLIYDAAFPRYD